MSRPSPFAHFAVQHLSDEAVAACADDVLTGTPRQRAERHLADCPECARAVAEQRSARAALQTAPLPALPLGLLDRLRTLPNSTPLGGGLLDPGPTGAPPALAVDADGRTVFAAFGTTLPPAPAPASPVVPPPAPGPSSPDRSMHGHAWSRLAPALPVGVGAVAAAVVVGVLAGTAADAGGTAGGTGAVSPAPSPSAAPSAMFVGP